MHIALNLLFAGAGVAGGRVYAEGLLRGLAALHAPDLEFTCFTRQATDLPPLPAERFHTYRSPVPEASALCRTGWEYLRLPGAVRRRGCQLLHGLGSLSPTAWPLPLVLTVHDLIYLHHPESTAAGYRLFMRLVGPRSARAAERILVPSQYTAQDVITHYGVRPERIRITPYGPGHAFRADLPEDEVLSVLTAYKLRRPYLLSVARGYPHKNLLGLLHALPVLGRLGWPDVQLVLAGERHRLGPQLDEVCRALHLKQRFVFTGFVDTPRLNALYCGAEAFVFPSLAEGFGMPPLEAMACGVPVVASNATAIPEVVGDAGLLADARDPEALAAAIARVLADAGLRADLRRKGLERARALSWERCAAATAAVYRELRG